MLPTRSFALKRIGKLLYPNLINNQWPRVPDQRIRGAEFSVSNLRFQELHHDLKRNEHFDIVKDKLNSFEIHQQRPNNIRFIEYENLFAFNVLKSYAEFPSKIIDGQQFDFSEFESEFYQRNDSEQLQKLLQMIDGFSVNQIVALQRCLLKNIPFYLGEDKWNQLYFGGNFEQIWRRLDSVAMKLMEECSITNNAQFYPYVAVSSLWFELGLARHVAMNSKLIKKLATHKQPLDRYLSLHLMFEVNLKRSIPKDLVRAIVSKTENFVKTNTLKLEELALVGMGFFKTQLKMPAVIVAPFLEQAKTAFASNEDANSMSVASILKVLRFSLETVEFDSRIFRKDILEMVNSLCAHEGNFLNSNICLTHLLMLLNAAHLQNQKRIYKTVFDQMVANLGIFRIKDIERVLFCLANAMFRCPNVKLNQIENHIFQSEESQTYPYHVYNIVYYFMTLEYFPRKLVKQVTDKEFLQKALVHEKHRLEDTLLITDTLLRLESRGHRILDEEQINEKRVSIQRNFSSNQDTKRSRFLRSIREVLYTSYGDSLQFMFLFPFAAYPFPVILREDALRQVKEQNNENGVIDYNQHFLRPSVFRGSKALQIILTKDKTFGPNIRGFAQVNRRLLSNLGFEVIQLEQRNFPQFVMPDTFCDRSSPDYRNASNELLRVVENSEN